MMGSVRAQSRDRARGTQTGIACELRPKPGGAVPELTMDGGPRIRAGLGDPGFPGLHHPAFCNPLPAARDGPLTDGAAACEYTMRREWFAEADRAAQRQELSHYDFILRGHQHETCARVGAKCAGSDDFVELAPGALRTKPHWYQGFMTTELDLRAGLMRLRAWTVSGHGRRWLPDLEFGNAGVEIRPLPDHLRISKVIQY
jgi:hypothetical protein